ncbi:hypothetical protein [Cytobacillus sp. IB215316]|uniref:hypothetical protein n=1 Tax=Cytobacillus sp. IB215316 TaxID=3097354 RepID=UPI002A16DC3F|nr:hypothetical protein [Cytobacillus sp. IB215316]MDX8363010.1 hypothetical protein [Cytobacillus sp. IB215316]
MPDERSRNGTITIKEDDAEDLFAYFSLDSAMKYYGQNALTSIDQVINLTIALKAAEEGKKDFRCGIQRKEDKKLIGPIGFNNYLPMHQKL